MYHQFYCDWSMCLSFWLEHFKNGPDYLTRRTAPLLIPLMRFLLQIWFSSCFFVCMRESFIIFSFISTCLIEFASNNSKYTLFSFSQSILILAWLVVLILLSVVFFSTFYYKHRIFFISIFHISWLFIIIASMRGTIFV